MGSLLHILCKPPAGARPRDIIVSFHEYDSKEALILAICNKLQIDYKGDRIQIFSDLSLSYFQWSFCLVAEKIAFNM